MTFTQTIHLHSNTFVLATEDYDLTKAPPEEINRVIEIHDDGTATFHHGRYGVDRTGDGFGQIWSSYSRDATQKEINQALIAIIMELKDKN